jgi:hypothetical protein
MAWTGTGNEIARAINAGICWFKNYEEEINSLNVFPVPDGDTGKNIKNTLQAVKKTLATTDKSSAGQVFTAASKGSLMGAKGCSGIIISLMFQGFAEKLQNKKKIGLDDFAAAMEGASQKAWDGISNPVKGTILSVADAAAKSAKASLENNVDSEEMFKRVLQDSHKALLKTKHQLPALKKANVVDAGGLGLVYFLEGVSRYIMAMPVTGIKAKRKVIKNISGAPFPSAARYCLEFILTGKSITAGALKDKLIKKGNSLIINKAAAGIYKVHLHTNEPHKVLENTRKSGIITKIKIDDMKKQHRDFLKMNYEKNSDSN